MSDIIKKLEQHRAAVKEQVKTRNAALTAAYLQKLTKDAVMEMIMDAISNTLENSNADGDIGSVSVALIIRIANNLPGQDIDCTLQEDINTVGAVYHKNSSGQAHVIIKESVIAEHLKAMGFKIKEITRYHPSSSVTMSRHCIVISEEKPKPKSFVRRLLGL